MEGIKPEFDDKTGIIQKTLVILECPVCVEYMSPPIKQCSQGHSLCGKCHSRCETCPCCRGQLINTRNIALESLATTIPLPCVNSVWGCKKLLKVEERFQHNIRCTSKPLQCKTSTGNCIWLGTLEKYKEHCRLPGHFVMESGTNFSVNNIQVPNLNFVVTAFDELFLFKHKYVDALSAIYWTVQFLGNGSEASNYIYDITISSPTVFKKSSYQHICQSIYIEDKDLFKDDCSIAVHYNNLSTNVKNGILLKVCITINEFKLLPKFLKGTSM